MDSREEKIIKEISVYLDRIEELEDETAEAVLLIDEGEEEYSGEVGLPVDFLPEDAGEGDYLTIKISITDKSKICIEEIADDDAILIYNDKKIYVPTNFLPEDAEKGDCLTLDIFRDEDKTNAALDEARQLLKELE